MRIGIGFAIAVIAGFFAGEADLKAGGKKALIGAALAYIASAVMLF